jgi:peptidoglycan/xylan/chitin deacetylase (PgdA/CDA1 family)
MMAHFAPRRFRLALPAAIAFSLAWAQALGEPRWLIDLLPGGPPDVTYYVNTDQRAIALTIDDGPDAQTTPRILDLLNAHGAKATFFVISGRVAGNEAILRRMVDEGHEIGNHLTQDRPSIKLSAEEFARALGKSHEILSRHASVRWFRPGSGWFNEEMVDIGWKKYAYRLALGSVYPIDAQIHAPALAASYILWSVEPGSIVVLHDVGDRGRRTIATLERVLPELKARNYRLVTLSALAALSTGSE